MMRGDFSPFSGLGFSAAGHFQCRAAANASCQQAQKALLCLKLMSMGRRYTKFHTTRLNFANCLPKVKNGVMLVVVTLTLTIKCKTPVLTHEGFQNVTVTYPV